jgi:hypothetical protein
MSTSRQLDIAQWLTDMAVRCTPRTSENIEVLALDYAQGLDDLPSEAFTPQSREAATRHFEHFPAYKPLRAWLDKWWSMHKPTMPLLASIDDPNLSDEDRSHVRSWINTRKDGGDLMQRLSQYHIAWPRAFAYIVRTDDQAAAIARARGWTQDPPVDVTEAGITRNLIKLEKLAGEGPVGVGLAAMGLSILRQNVQQRAPERVHLLPERIVAPETGRHRTVAQQRAAMGDPPAEPTRAEALKAEFVAKHGRAPGQPSAEQLAEIRKAAGINLPPPKPDLPTPANDPSDRVAKTDTPPLEGEVIPPATASGAAWRAPWED